MKTFALQTAQAPVSEFLVRFYQGQPTCTWDMTVTELRNRFGEIIDSQHALQVLRATKQTAKETAQVYAERLLVVAEQAWPGSDLKDSLIERQMIDVFIDGLTDNQVARKVIRGSSVTFNAAVQAAVLEQNMTRRFELRKRGGQTNNKQYKPKYRETGPERQETPMEIDNFRGSCFKCGAQGHRAVHCRTKKIHEVKQLECWRCGEAGHGLDRCPNRGIPQTGRCWHCGDKTHRKYNCPKLQTAAAAQSNSNTLA